MTVWLTAKNNEKLHQIKKLHYLCVEVATRVTLTETSKSFFAFSILAIVEVATREYAH